MRRIIVYGTFWAVYMLIALAVIAALSEVEKIDIVLIAIFAVPMSFLALWVAKRIVARLGETK